MGICFCLKVECDIKFPKTVEIEHVFSQKLLLLNVVVHFGSWML